MLFKTDYDAFIYYQKIHGFLAHEKKRNYFINAMEERYSRNKCYHLNKVEWERFWHEEFDKWAYDNEVEWEQNYITFWW